MSLWFLILLIYNPGFATLFRFIRGTDSVMFIFNLPRNLKINITPNPIKRANPTEIEMKTIVDAATPDDCNSLIKMDSL